MSTDYRRRIEAIIGSIPVTTEGVLRELLALWVAHGRPEMPWVKWP